MVNLSDSLKLSCKIKQMLYNHAGVMCRIGVMNPVLRKMYESKQNKKIWNKPRNSSQQKL